MNKNCARCNKIVYPIEELKCLDKVCHVFLYFRHLHNMFVDKLFIKFKGTVTVYLLDTKLSVVFADFIKIAKKHEILIVYHSELFLYELC